jgi:hypothetical protein
MNPPEPPFTITCHAGFDDSGFWLIDARITWRNGMPPQGSQALGEARMAMLIAIAREAQRGRSLGAMKVHVHMEGHGAQVNSEGDLTEPEP